MEELLISFGSAATLGDDGLLEAVVGIKNVACFPIFAM
jgi:hypothetical protein